ncbi:MAG TPA: TPM domain-containing protein, partial [Polyangiaceae bacterium]
MLFVALAFLLPVLGVSPAAFAKEVPPLQGHVNDTAGLLSAAQRARLEQRLTEYERKTGQQFALLTVDTLDGD